MEPHALSFTTAEEHFHQKVRTEVCKEESKRKKNGTMKIVTVPLHNQMTEKLSSKLKIPQAITINDAIKLTFYSIQNNCNIKALYLNIHYYPLNNNLYVTNLGMS